MTTYVWLIHIVSVVLFAVMVIIPLVLLVKEKRAHAADVERLESEIATLRSQNQSWQSAASDF